MTASEHSYSPIERTPTSSISSLNSRYNIPDSEKEEAKHTPVSESDFTDQSIQDDTLAKQTELGLNDKHTATFGDNRENSDLVINDMSSQILP